MAFSDTFWLFLKIPSGIGKLFFHFSNIHGRRCGNSCLLVKRVEKRGSALPLILGRQKNKKRVAMNKIRVSNGHTLGGR